MKIGINQLGKKYKEKEKELEKFMKKHKIDYEAAEIHDWAGDIKYYITEYRIDDKFKDIFDFHQIEYTNDN